MPSPSVALPSEVCDRRALLADPTLYGDLKRYVRSRVQGRDADDVVHASLADALAAESAPETREDLRRWVFAIARHKIADHYRQTRGQRQMLEANEQLPADGGSAEPAPHAARDLLRWALRELPRDGSAEDTLEWMLREGEGDPLEEIARENQLPAPRLRQRVSRLRRYYRSRWAAHLTALGLLTLAGFVAYGWLARAPSQPEPAPIARETPPPADSARALRRQAFDDCARLRFEPCLQRLDHADRLDPLGANAPEVRAAREAATRALTPSPSPSPSSSSESHSSPKQPPKQSPKPKATAKTTLNSMPSSSSDSAPTPAPTSAPASKVSSDFIYAKPRPADKTKTGAPDDSWDVPASKPEPASK